LFDFFLAEGQTQHGRSFPTKPVSRISPSDSYPSTFYKAPPTISELLDRSQYNPICRMLFSLSCAERLFPFFESYYKRTKQGDPGLLRSALNELWESVIQNRPCGRLSFLDEYESQIPDDDIRWTPLNPLAENAVAALTYACLCQVENEIDNALWAAVQGYEAVDHIAHTIQDIEFEELEAEAVIVSNEYIQSELNIQLRDIAELGKITIGGEEFQRLTIAFRRRAESEGQSLSMAVSELPVGSKNTDGRKTD
jgi:uncharacterized protein YjaG (DUF416 family)